MKRVDTSNRRIYYKMPWDVEESVKYDYLVLAPGVVYDGDVIEGYRENMGRIVNVYELAVCKR